MAKRLTPDEKKRRRDGVIKVDEQAVIPIRTSMGGERPEYNYGMGAGVDPMMATMMMVSAMSSVRRMKRRSNAVPKDTEI